MDVNTNDLQQKSQTLEMTDPTQRLKALKAWYRLRMNGVVSHSLRDKGLAYKIIWGVSLPELKAKAAETGKDPQLARLLWKEDIRESKILALMIMPSDEMTTDETDKWIKEIPNQEIAEIAAMHLFRHIEGAKELAIKWIKAENDNTRICGFHTLCRLFMKGTTLTQAQAETFTQQAQAALNGSNLSVSHAANNALQRYKKTD